MTEKNIFDLKGAVSEAKARAKADADRRAAAGSEKKDMSPAGRAVNRQATRSRPGKAKGMIPG